MIENLFCPTCSEDARERGPARAVFHYGPRANIEKEPARKTPSGGRAIPPKQGGAIFEHEPAPPVVLLARSPSAEQPAHLGSMVFTHPGADCRSGRGRKGKEGGLAGA